MIKKNKISQADKKTWEDYTKNPTDIIDKEKFEKKKLLIIKDLNLTYMVLV